MIIKKGSIVKLINTSELDWYKNGDKFIAIEDDCCPYCVFPEDYNPEYVYKDYVDHYIPITAFMHYKLDVIGNVFTKEDEDVEAKPKKYRVVAKGTIGRLLDDSTSAEFKDVDILVAIETNPCPYWVKIKDYNEDYDYNDYVDKLIPIECLTTTRFEMIGNVSDSLEDQPTEPNVVLTHTNEKKEGKKMWAAITMGALLVTAFGLIIYDLKTNK